MINGATTTVPHEDTQMATDPIFLRYASELRFATDPARRAQLIAN